MDTRTSPPRIRCSGNGTWARNHAGVRHMDDTVPNAGHRALAALQRNDM